MPQVVSVKVEGLDTLQANLERIPRNIARHILRDSIRPAAQVFLDEMLTRVRRRTGFLAEHLKLVSRVREAELSAIALVGATRTNYPQRIGKRGRGSTIRASDVARYLEFGTRKMADRAFMAASFESRKQNALDTFVAKARAAFATAASRPG